MKISLRSENGIGFITFHENIIKAETDLFAREVKLFEESRPWKGIILNLEHVEMIDSSGFGWLALLYKNHHQSSRKLLAYQAIPPMVNLFKMTGMDQIIGLYPTEKQAIEALDSH